jgi:hypothetical protein
MTLPISIITTEGDHVPAETPDGSVEAASSGELLKDSLANLEDELAEPARLSHSATDRTNLLELARTSPPPDAWFDED